MTIRHFAAVAGAALALSACATDRHGPPAAAVREAPNVLLSADALVFATFDKNDDLRIDQAELAAGIAHEFARADTNHDGSISPIEFQAWVQNALGGANAPPYRLDFDRNVDNSVTAAEFAAELTARFNDYDKNHDGVLTRDEFLRVSPRAQQMMRERGEGAGPSGGEGGGGMHRRRGGGGEGGGGYGG